MTTATEDVEVDNFDSSSDEEEDAGTEICIKNLSRHVTEDHLREVVSAFGRVLRLKLDSQGEALVSLQLRSQASLSLSCLDGATFDSAKLVVSYVDEELQAEYEQEKKKEEKARLQAEKAEVLRQKLLRSKDKTGSRSRSRSAT
ncbi:MAG: hypothetical protein MHM6MM_008586 [Cercozoa sp. M6MM]